MTRAILKLPLAIALATSQSAAADVAEKAPGTGAAGRVYAWQSGDGLGYHYLVPRGYDPEKGAPLTFILHGSNLDRRWGFANHGPGKFRPADIVVAPEGTTSNGRGGFNFLGRPDDVQRFESLHAELAETFKVTATYLYGHSQGSFFALHYAGERPDRVDGVLAHASGAWAQTRTPEAARDQAIVFMHGTQDPVVPYSQSLAALETYRGKGYRQARLRTLEGWNHWPAEHNGPVPHASRQLAWIEGMTSDDPSRVGAAFRALSDASDKEHRDFQALYLLSARILEMPALGARAGARAREVMGRIDALATRHVEAMRAPAPEAIGGLVDEAWVGHLPMFLRHFGGVPAADALASTWEGVLSRHREAAADGFGAYRHALAGGDTAGAFEAGAGLLSNAYLWPGVGEATFLEKMEAWAGDRDLDLPKDSVKAFKSTLKTFRDAREDGAKAFWAENKRARM